MLSLLLLATAAAAGTPKPAQELAPYPPMHWHSWNTFCAEDMVNATNMREMAEALLATGMADAGYRTVNVVCNGWTGRNASGVLQENTVLWPDGGIAAFADYLHARNLSLGCYTSPAAKNCCGEPGSLGYEAIDMEFFARVGCDHVMVDWCRGYVDPLETKAEYAVIGEAIANSSNPDMLYGIWPGGMGKSWKWSADVGGHYWRTAADIKNSWKSVTHNFDTAFSIPDIDSFTSPGRYTFLDQMVVGVPGGGHGDDGHKGGVPGPGLSATEMVSHMSMWVMAASPLLTCNDVRNMSKDVLETLTNPEVLAVHKDPLAQMAVRIDVGGGLEESHANDLCASEYSVYGRQLADGSSAVMVLNRGESNTSVTLLMEDVGDSMHTTYGVRDLWAKVNLSNTSVVDRVALTVPSHGVRMLRLWPMAPAPPPPSPPPPPPPPPTPAEKCPADFTAHAPGFWKNTDPCPNSDFKHCTEDHANGTLPLCAAKCRATAGCVAFEVNAPSTAVGACYIFLHSMALPFTPVAGCFACVRKKAKRGTDTALKLDDSAAATRVAVASKPKKTAAEIAPYPPMHWHSWNTFCGEDKVNEANMHEMTQALISSGMVAAGYTTVNVVCNGWTGRNSSGVLQENRKLWPDGIAAFADHLHGLNMSLGCYTSPATKNCCGEPGALGYESVDMEFFARVGCDHVMVDWCRAYDNPKQARDAYAVVGEAIANSSNPNMLYGIWSAGIGKSWKWSADVGGHYWRTATDIYNQWSRPSEGSPPFWQGSGSVLHNFDEAYSIPGISKKTKPGRYTFLDQMVVGVVPGGKAIGGPGLSFVEAQAHMSMWVMAASPLLTCNDVRNMSAEIKEILTNPEVLAVHKDPLAQMAVRIDVGGGVEEAHANDLCASEYSVYGRQLTDGSSAVMVLNRGESNTSVTLLMEDVGDSMHTTYGVRDLWAKANLSAGPVVKEVALTVPSHGVRMLRLWPMKPAPAPSPAPSPPPGPRPPCPAGFQNHTSGFWSNLKIGAKHSTVAECATTCTDGCVAFEVFLGAGYPGQCYTFMHTLGLPFTAAECATCVKKAMVEGSEEERLPK